MFEALSQSPARNLVLKCVSIDHSFRLDHALVVWPLRSLHLGVTGMSNPPSQIRRMCNGILRLCAPHLETLRWYQLLTSNPCHLQSFSGDTVRTSQFPVLRQLQLSKLRFADYSVFEALIPLNGRLRELDVEHTHVGSYLEECGPFQSLESLTWLPQDDVSEEQLVQILRNNSHLKKLNLRRAYTESFMELHLLPLLSSSFKALTSLSLIGLKKALDETSLNLIGQIHTLELLHLSAGTRRRPASTGRINPLLLMRLSLGTKQDRATWIVDHNIIRCHLSTLQKLKKLLLSRDARRYRPGLSDEDDEADTSDHSDDTSDHSYDMSTHSDNVSIHTDNVSIHSDNMNTHGDDIETLSEIAGHSAEDENDVNADSQDEESGDEISNIEGWDDDGSDASFDEYSLQASMTVSSGPDSEGDTFEKLIEKLYRNGLMKEVKKYFTTFKELEMIYMEGWPVKRGGGLPAQRIDPDEFVPAMLGRVPLSEFCP
jgi:hypothetical protein